MKRIIVTSLLVSVLLSACGFPGDQGADADESRVVTVYKLPT